MTIKLGITGGIGSGKSGVAELLRVYGVPVYDCDSEAQRLMNGSSTIRSALTALTGNNHIYQADGLIDRRQLAGWMFGHDERVTAVNAIVHPTVRADFAQWAQKHAAYPVIALESAILFEAGMKGDVDHTLLVYTPAEERLQRAMQRDGATREQVMARMSNQTPDEEHLHMADFVIQNGEDDAITPQVERLLDIIAANHKSDER